VNAFTIYCAVAIQRPGLKVDADFRFQLAIWVIVMTEWPQTWRTLAMWPQLVDVLRAKDAHGKLRALKSEDLPCSRDASERELDRILADRQLVQLLTGKGTPRHAPLSAKVIPTLAEITPLRTRRWRLPDIVPASGRPAGRLRRGRAGCRAERNDPNRNGIMICSMARCLRG
jgi:hypothetical protein